MKVDLRKISPDEFGDFSAVMGHAFGWDTSDEDLEFWKEALEFERSLAAFDSDRIVGTAGAYSFELTVPGGAQVPAAGVTVVSVLPTHRRQGVLTAMMQHQLADVRDRGEPIALLWASESVIYGRYGYGTATRNAEWEIERAHTRLEHSANPEGRVRLSDTDEARKVLPALHDEIRGTTPGMISRPQSHWDWLFRDSADHRDGASANRYVLYEEDGDTLGGAVYRVKTSWDGGFGNSTVLVRQFLPTTLRAYEALWGHCFSLDLVASIKASFRPPDEPLRWMLADPRRLRAKIADGLWARIVDVPAALSARTYQQEGKVVLRVTDEFLHDVGGTFVLEGGPDGATCSPTGAEPDLTIDVQSLGAIYLGAHRLAALQQAGRLEGDPATVRVADTMFRADRDPWCPVMF